MESQAKESKLSHTVAIIAPLAGLIATIIATRSDVPLLLKGSMVVLLVIILIISLYEVLLKPLLYHCKRRVEEKKQTILAKKYSPPFKRFVDRFADLTNIDHCDTILYFLNQVQQKICKPKFENILPSPFAFRRIFEVFNDAAENLPTSKENFFLLIKWFESIFNLYNEHLICKPIDEMRKSGTVEIPDYTKENYKKCKFGYDKFIVEYMDFAKEINKDFGDRVARDYFQRPKEL